jgi:transcriptional regulator GlxA family with amidase domain
MEQPRRVLIVGFPGAELLDIACITSTLTMANYLRGSALYRPKLVSPGGAEVTTGSGLVLKPEGALERVRGPVHTLIVSGGIGYLDAMNDPTLVAHVRRLGALADRVASVCTGAGILAAAGLLDGRRAATHWFHASALAERFPDVTFDPEPIFVTDDGVCTSAGVTAALDLTLSFVEADGGADLARDVSRHLVTYLQRPGNQAQMSMFTAAPAAGDSVVHDLVEHIAGHLDDDLSTEAIAVRAGVSERQLGRLFLRELGTTPGRYVRTARTEAAAQLLATSDLSLDRIAARCGLGTAETVRQTFLKHYGVTPSHYRATQASAARH